MSRLSLRQMPPNPSRRELLTALALMPMGAMASRAFAQSAPRATPPQTTPPPTNLLTPRQTEGPFYPINLPADQDNDLVTVKGAASPAKGEVTHLSGRVLDANGRPIRGVRVEIWQCDANGRYHHPGDRSGPAADPNFQGFGHDTSGVAGAYAFRTIRPVPYPGRTPHIHFKLRSRDFPEFVTQMYIAGHPQNAGDGLLAALPDARRRASLMANFLPIKGPGGAIEHTARFDIVLGVTPAQT